MNIRQFSIALMISALPALAQAGQALSLNHGDFIAARKISSNGETTVTFKLSKSGKAKLKKLGKGSGDKEILHEIVATID
jgi:hypothetical protein